jgi:hypothetical protein
MWGWSSSWLVSMLRQPDQAGRYQQHVVVAQATADA